MASSPLDEQTIKHLEFIQAVIGRLSGDAFLLKGWALTVSGAFFGFSAKDLNWRVALVGLAPLIAFWSLDAYFLSRERLYRALYDAVRRGTADGGRFSMAYNEFRSARNSWPACLMSWTVAGFYLPTLAVGVALIAYTATHG